MNFLGHYYVDRHEQNPYFTFGALLPDLVRGFSKIYNQLDKSYESRNLQHQAIFLGLKRHMKTDAIFHNQETFQSACNEIVAILNSEPTLDLPRTFFLAHILVELLIDKNIVAAEIEVATDFYKQLADINKIELISFCNSIQFFEFGTIYLAKFELFLRNEYALKLKDNENVYVALSRICFDRINFIPSVAQKNMILELIGRSDRYIKNCYKAILAQTIENLNNE